ncbi:MAG: hypothetical protein ACYSUD_14445, partial [Planctomycetota bacterium]
MPAKRRTLVIIGPTFLWVFDENRVKSRETSLFRVTSGGPKYIYCLRLSAILALGRLRSQSALPRLKELYRSNNMQIRLLAALSLYSLGDDTGFELIEHFVNGTEFSLSDIGDIPEWPWLDTFLCSVLHLRPHTDELLLKCFGSSHFHPYPYYRWADTIGDAEYAFARQYERQLLPVLVEQL